MWNKLGRIGLHVMRLGLVASLGAVMIGIWVMTDPAKLKTAPTTNPTNPGASSPSPPNADAESYYRQLGTEAGLVEGARGLVRLGDGRVIPLLMAVVDRHDPELAEPLSTDWALGALTRLLGQERTDREWLAWWQEHRRDYVECRFHHRYRIRQNDTLWDISKRVYGEGTHHALLRDYNRGRIPNPDRLPVGKLLIIPHPASRTE